MASATKLLSTAIAVLLFVSPSPSDSASSDWGYGPSNGPSTWGNQYKDCKLAKQSPIDVILKQVQRSTQYTNLTLTAPSVTNTKLKNTGSSLKATLDDTSVLTLTGGPLQQRQFQVAQFHLHFAVNGGGGSEHRINSQHTAAELHVVTYNKAFGNLSYAASQPGGLAVIGVMLERVEGNVTNTPAALTKFLQESAKLMFKDNETPLNINLQSTFPTDWASSFFFYDGSLTTPPCGEVVNWLLCRSMIQVSAEDIDALSGLHTGTAPSSPLLSGNYRPPQPIGSRTVYYTGTVIPSGATAKGPGGLLVSTALAVLAVVFMH